MTTAMTTLEIKNLIGRMVKNKRAARAACTLEQTPCIPWQNNVKLPHLRGSDDDVSINTIAKVLTYLYLF